MGGNFSLHHTGSGAFWTMLRECHRHIFGENHQAQLSVVQALPAAFDAEKRLDYDTRTDDNPVYIGFAEYLFTSATDTITPTVDSDIWIIQKLTYDGSDRETRIQVQG